MKSVSLLKDAGVLLLLVVLHYTVRPLLGSRVSVDFLVLAVLLVSVRVRPGAAALAGLAVGVIADSLAPLSFGAGAMSLSAVGFAASWLKAAVFSDNVMLQAIFFAAGKWAFDLLYVLAERRMAPGELLMQMAFWSPLSAVATGLAGVLVVLVFRMSMESRP